jgi:DNA-binding CsgD family transcriptional regulator
MSPSAKDLSALLGPLYEAAASPELWPQFFEVLRTYINTNKAFFLLIDPENCCDIHLSYGMDSAWQRAYVDHYQQHDVLLNRFVAAKQGYGEWIGTTQSVISDGEYHRSILYNDFAKPQGQFHHCAAALAGLDGGIEGGIAINRTRQEGPFNAEEIALLAMLAPHLKRALNMHRTLSMERANHAVLRQTVEALDLSLVSLDGCSRVLRMTVAARTILELRDGIALDKGFLRARAAGEQVRLTELVAGAVSTGNGRGQVCAVRRSTVAAPEAGRRPLWTPSSGGAMLISRGPPKRPLQVVVTPFYSGEILLDEHPAALVFLSDPDGRPASRSPILYALYGLSPTQCRLVGLLAQGCEVAAASEVLRMTVATARFHLKNIFRKTGTARQSELVRLVLGLPGTRTIPL